MSYPAFTEDTMEAELFRLEQMTARRADEISRLSETREEDRVVWLRAEREILTFTSLTPDAAG